MYLAFVSWAIRYSYFSHVCSLQPTTITNTRTRTAPAAVHLFMFICTIISQHAKVTAWSLALKIGLPTLGDLF